MQFLINATQYVITYRVICGVESWTSTEVVYANSSLEARGKFRLSKGSLFKILSVEEK